MHSITASKNSSSTAGEGMRNMCDSEHLCQYVPQCLVRRLKRKNITYMHLCKGANYGERRIVEMPSESQQHSWSWPDPFSLSWSARVMYQNWACQSTLCQHATSGSEVASTMEPWLRAVQQAPLAHLSPPLHWSPLQENLKIVVCLKSDWTSFETHFSWVWSILGSHR